MSKSQIVLYFNLRSGKCLLNVDTFAAKSLNRPLRSLKSPFIDPILFLVIMFS